MKKFKTYTLLLFLTAIVSCRKDNTTLNNVVTPNDFLSNSHYDNLIVEIQYVNGYEPTAATVDNLKIFLQQRLNKSKGITVTKNSIAPPGKTAYSLEDIKNTEKKHRTQNTTDKTLTAYFLFIDGDYSGSNGNAKVLGIAYSSSSMAIFEKTIKDFSGGIGQPAVSTLETTVTEHEVGHILGLVNNGTPLQSQHQDAAHGSHCNDQNCLMYYTVETTDIISNIIGGNIPQLTAQCINDLRANGGK